MALQVFPDISKRVSLSDGTNYAYIRIPAVDSTKPTFLLLHGFPSSSYDWRHVVPKLKESGYGVIAPDLLGYGDTDKPAEVAEYSFKRMGNDLAELIHLENLSKVIGVGHDWGSGVLSATALLHPQMFSGLVFLAAGYIVPGAVDIDALNSFTEQTYGDPTFGYWKFFNEESAARILDANPASITSLLYPTIPDDWKTSMGPWDAAKSWVSSGRVTPLPIWLGEEEAKTRNRIFEQGGYTGPLNWYKSAMRGIDIPWTSSSLVTDDQKSLDIPTVIVAAEYDYVCRPELQKPRAEQFLRNHRIEQFQCGHWIQLEKPDELVKLLVEFSGSLENMLRNLCMIG